MNFSDLRHFLVVADELRIENAGERLGIQALQLSRSMRNLERYLGFRLVNRARKQTRLTAAGSTFIDDAKRILRWVDQAPPQAAAPLVRTGQLRIGVSTRMDSTRLADMLARCRVDSPDLELILVLVEAETLLGDLRKGKIDIAVTARRFDGRHLRCEPLWIDSMVAVLPDNHALAHKSSLRLTELACEKLLLCPSELVPSCNGLLERMNIATYLTLAQVVDEHLMTAMVGAGYGAGVALASQADLLRAPGVTSRPLADCAFELAIYAVARVPTASDALDWFLDRARVSWVPLVFRPPI